MCIIWIVSLKKQLIKLKGIVRLFVKAVSHDILNSLLVAWQPYGDDKKEVPAPILEIVWHIIPCINYNSIMIIFSVQILNYYQASHLTLRKKANYSFRQGGAEKLGQFF